MISVYRQNFKKLVEDLIASETHLTVVVKEGGQNVMSYVYCESHTLNELKKQYTDEKKLYKYIEKHFKELPIHTALYNKNEMKLTIDGKPIPEKIKLLD